MSDPVTEIVYIPLVAGTDLTGTTKEPWGTALQTLASQSGCTCVRWGMQVEHPDVVQLAIGLSFSSPSCPSSQDILTQPDWDNIASHQAFAASPAYGPFIEIIKSIMSSFPQVFHLRMPPNAAALDAPTTECVTMYFPPDFETATYDASWKKFLDAAAEETAKAPNGSYGINGGWSVETHEHEQVGKEAKAFGGFLGWENVDAHMAFREKENFPSIVKWLREGTAATKMHHVHFTKV